MAFLDFKKAFPSVWREGLWGKMRGYGIEGKFLRLYGERLYSDVGARVRVGKVFSERFMIKEGLRQGCILSPTLFSLYIWRLGTEEIKEVNEYKYLGVWINRQATGHNHINHLEEKAMGLHNLARGAKFGEGMRTSKRD